MKGKIVCSTGFGLDTKVFGDEGQDLTNLLHIKSVHIEADQLVIATLQLSQVALEMDAELKLQESDLRKLAAAQGFKLVRTFGNDELE